jgi:hypothetical protein
LLTRRCALIADLTEEEALDDDLRNRCTRR